MLQVGIVGITVRNRGYYRTELWVLTYGMVGITVREYRGVRSYRYCKMESYGYHEHPQQSPTRYLNLV